MTPGVSKISPKLSHVVFCLENWAQKGSDPNDVNLTQRGIYSIVVAIFQYLLPLLIVLVIYAMIYRFLRQQQYPRHLRQSKTNSLLASISITHCLIWLPFSLFNIFADLWPETLFRNDPELMITVYCGVHLIGLLSTCTNPVLYAFFNENLRREFEFLAEKLCPGFLYRSHSTNMGRLAKNSPNGNANLPKIRPRRDNDNTQWVDEDDIELDPTYHKETGEDDQIEEECPCFKQSLNEGFELNELKIDKV